ncbi:class I SAM-dependent methyltransferase [Leifsonia shinshuensis]|uniref:class I SAM-dependent methyltransferase n=1 Tax=Leifsonia shinshuensis TaxID=150026 RepID=UPI001F50758C|nr:class I SAM-dependent methyltransferase [Leifsonia shinshuensis]MCI0156058.1 class I SAM-dependent methyltransferase [Leifsonia shinshuensis]
MQQRREREAHARSFDRAARIYDASRPGYPADAVAWLTDGTEGPVVDLGAGTGKLTRALIDRGREVVAVDPSPQMLEVLGERVPEADVRLGSAEGLPVPDASAGLVVAAQAWHWVDPAVAVPEVARALRPGGRLGLVWNDRDENVEWVRELGELMGSGDAVFGDEEDPVVGPPFGALERFDVRWVQAMSLDGLLDLARSRSYFITKDPGAQAAVIGSLRRLHAEHPDLAGAETIELPYVTRCYRATLGG